MKQLAALTSLALSIAAFAPVNSHQCEAVNDSVLQPGRNILTFLNMNPDIDMLSGPGCIYILNQFKNLPSGAELVRQMAGQRVEHTSSRCLYPINSVQYLCDETALGESPRCLPQAYTYCGQWEYSMTNQENSYEAAMELALKLDTAYDKAQALCGMAMDPERGNAGIARALSFAHELQAYLTNEIHDSSETIYQISCPSQ